MDEVTDVYEEALKVAEQLQKLSPTELAAAGNIYAQLAIAEALHGVSVVLAEWMTRVTGGDGE